MSFDREAALGSASTAMDFNTLRKISSNNVTVSQNIDFRIADLRNQIERLERTKAILAEPGGILNVPLDDLRFAMSY